MLIIAEDIHFAQLLDAEAQLSFVVAEGGLETPEVLAMLKGLAVGVRRQFSPAAWLISEDGEVIGLCSLMSAPDDDGVVSIGYGIAASRRGRGAAGRAVADVLRWAMSEPRVTAVAAETSVHNIASQRVLEGNSFVRVGTRIDDEDGELICWKALAAD